MNAPQYATMDGREKYLFDLQGYLVIRGFLTSDEVESLNQALDANPGKRGAYGDPTAEFSGTPMEGIQSPFSRFGGLLEWDRPWCLPFRNLLAHPRLIPYLNTMMGRGWRLDHEAAVVTSEIGCEGLPFHASGNYKLVPSRYYAYQNGMMRGGLTVCQFFLSDVNPGDGGLTLVPGSHKANFLWPMHVRLHEADQEIYRTPVLRAGDVVIFNEATTHGTLPWKGSQERRTVLYRYIPKHLQYVDGYYATEKPGWMSELTEAQQAVLERPYIYHRPLIEDDGETIVKPQEEEDWDIPP